MRADFRRRWIERGKSLLILLLTLSAVFLVYQSPLIQGSGLGDLLASGRPDSAGKAPSSSPLAVAAIPMRMAVGSELGLYGVQYDQEVTDALFETAAPLLGEALSAAQDPVSMSQTQWRALLNGPCVYFDFTCPVPLSALCSWLKDGAENPRLTASARHILLALESDGSLSLCFQAGDGSGFFRCATTLDAVLHLTPILESVSPNSAFFAFDTDTLPAVVAPYTMFTNEEIAALVYSSSTPALLSDAAQAAKLLSALSFSDQNRAAASDGVLYVDSYDTLRLSSSGRVYYDSSSGGKYPAGSSLPDAVESAWLLAEAALDGLCGDARLYLMSAHPGDEVGSYTITFGYALNGSTVYLYDQGWAAQFQVQNGFIHKFTLYPRTYTSTGQKALLLPAEKAAVALEALAASSASARSTNQASQQLELVILYRDNGGSQVSPSWNGR